MPAGIFVGYYLPKNSTCNLARAALYFSAGCGTMIPDDAGAARVCCHENYEEAKGCAMNEEQLSDFSFEDELDIRITPPPLADPVFSKLFQNAEVGGLAMKELLNATLEDSGDVPIGDIISLTPQSLHSDTSERAYRIDVEAVTVKGEAVIMEVQMSRFASTIERTLLYSEQALATRARIGAALKDVTVEMPRVVALNILDFDLRANGVNFHQVAELTYREEPRERATDKFEIHNLELKKFRRSEPDLSKPLHCWLTAVCRAQDEEKSLKEVVGMDTTLQEYYKSNPGFAQFTDRHDRVSAEPEVRRDYRRWQYEQMVNALEKRRIVEESEVRGEARGEARGRALLYMQSLPFYFESIKANPSFKREIFALGAEAGVDEDAIQREYEKWARANLEKAIQPDSRGRTSVSETLKAGRLIQETGKAEKKKTKRQDRDER
jgi:predicted transposase/invertase (TIGR01784 family)